MSNLDELIKIDEFNELDERERSEVLKILEEYSRSGMSSTYTDLIYDDYREIPVDIITFIKDPKYLGNAWFTPSGKCKLFPYWEEKLQQLFPDPFTTNYNNFIESGARGLGKSEIAVTCALYMMYRVMCLKNPHEYLNLKPTEKVAFAFMNITEALAMDIGISKFQATVQLSPWFLERGTITGKNELVWNPPDFINIIIGSQPRHVIGQPIFFAFFDEISFIPNQDIEKQKQKAIDMIDTAIGGMKTRFTNHGKNPTLLVLASSKRSDKSFLEEHMKKKVETEGENTFIVDEPVWNIRPASEYSGKRFYVAQGNKFLASEVLPDNTIKEDLKVWIDKGYKILEVPVEYKAKFLEEIDRALCDYAGISSSDLTKYISGARLSNAKKAELSNLFTKDVITVGNALEDTVQYSDFFDLTRIPPELKARPLYIHMDMSVSGDKTGIAGTWIMGKKPNAQVDSNDLLYRLAFSVSIQAPKGYQISFEKNRNFIFWLKEQGFNIKGISTDTYQSVDTGQQLAQKGFNYCVVSVDRVDSDRICKPYQYLKSAIYENRVELYDSELLTIELLGLERNGNSGKIDHPDGGKSGSKDQADAFCGSLWNASMHADEYNFEFGEDLDALVSVSSGEGGLTKKQLMVDFENELKKISPFHDSMQVENRRLGYDPSYAFLMEGIII